MKLTNYSVFNEDVTKHGLEYALEHTVSLGLGAVEFLSMVHNGNHILTKTMPKEKIKGLLDSYGLSVSCYSVGVNFLEGDIAEKERDMRENIELAAVLGSPCFHHTVTMLLSPAPGNPSYDEVLERVFPVVDRVAKYCEELGLTCLYEPQGMYFNGIKGLKGLVDKLKANGRKVGVCADFGNSLFVDEAPNEVIGAFIDDVRHVHVKDYVASSEPINGIVDLKSKGGKYLYHSELGTGVANVDACFELLKKVGYSGNISFEIDVNDGEMKRSMDIVRKKLG